jgi:hypothetical protein
MKGETVYAPTALGVAGNAGGEPRAPHKRGGPRPIQCRSGLLLSAGDRRDAAIFLTFSFIGPPPPRVVVTLLRASHPSGHSQWWA